ncbi:MAG: choice-of-anchor U domain-containing protein [Thermodesulfobacteriota bacterium]|nr:choice-of-anchor U domain-containing protein [Thermodesulfobacteriota bacterium]
MKRTTLGLTILIVLLAFTQVQATVVWKADYHEFRYGVEICPDGGIFLDRSTMPPYFNPSGSAAEVFTNMGAMCGTFQGTAAASLPELGGAIELKGMAKGPDQGVNPQDGIVVHASNEVNLNGFHSNHGVDVNPVVRSLISRRFTVSMPGEYHFWTHFKGTADFDAFGNEESAHHAVYSATGQVVLEEYEEGTPPNFLRKVADFAFENGSAQETIIVELSNQARVFYQLRVVLELTSDIQNLDFFTVTGPLTGPFQLGTQENPFELGAFVALAPPTPQYTLTANSNGQGAVAIDPPGGLYDEGTVVGLTATPAPGWYFGGWTGDVADPNAPATTITMNADKEVTATFTETPPGYTLTMAVTGEGTTTPEVGDHDYDMDAVVDIEATPADGWYFTQWTGDVEDPNAPSTTVTMDGDKTVTAVFTDQIPQVTLTMAVEGEGATTPEAGDHTYNMGDEVGITATAADGWQFVSWSQNVADPNASTTTVTMDDSKTVTATFTELPQYTLTVAIDPEASGSVALDPDGGTYAEGTVVQLSATPIDGLYFDEWTGDLSGSQNPGSITMDGDKTVTATFTDEPPPANYTLTTVINGEGAVTLDPEGNIYEEGTVVTVTATPAADWMFDQWSGNVANPYAELTTVTMDGDKSITADFLLDADGNGVPDDQDVAAGIDLNGDGIDDIDQPDVIKSVNTVVGDCQMGVEVGDNVASIDSVKAVSPQGDMPIGALCFKLSVNDSMNPADVMVYFCRPATEDAMWYQYNPMTEELTDYSDHATFSQDRMSVVLALMDGDYGDADGTVDTVIVHFGGPTGVTLPQYSLTVNTSGEGTGSVNLDPAEGPYDAGTVVTLTAAAEAGSAFAEWTGDVVGSQNPAVITMDGDKSVTADFAEVGPGQYTLSVTTDGTGSGVVILDPASGAYDADTVVSLSGQADDGSEFTEWSGDLTGSENPTTITMDGDKSVTATFTALTQYTLTVTLDPETSGTVTLDPPGGTYAEGTVVTLTAQAEDGWRFSEWTGDLTGSDSPVTITMDSDKAVTAAFAEYKKLKRHHSDCFIGTASSGPAWGHLLEIVLIVGATLLVLCMGASMRKRQLVAQNKK